MDSRRRWTSIAGAVALTALLGLDFWLVAARATALIRTGEPVGVVLGIAFWALPVLGVWLVYREWSLAPQG